MESCSDTVGLAQCTSAQSLAGALHCPASEPSGFKCIHKISATSS